MAILYFILTSLHLISNGSIFMLNFFLTPSVIFLWNGISRLSLAWYVRIHIKIPFIRLERKREKKINIESNLITLENFNENQYCCNCNSIRSNSSSDNSIFSCNVRSQFSIKIKAIITNAIPSIVSKVFDVCWNCEGETNVFWFKCCHIRKPH